LDDPELIAYAVTNIGVVELLAGNGTKELERALEISRRAELEEHAGRAFLNLTWWSNRGRAYTSSDRFLGPGLEYCTERGLEMWRSFLLASRARAELDRGRWDDAVDSAGLVLRDPRSSPVPRITALAVVGLVRARRGDPEVWPPLDEAWELAKGTGELQRMEPPAAARAEAAWLEGRPEAVVDATGEVLDLAVDRRAWWIVGELAFWRRSAGVDEEVPETTVDPWAAQLRGDWRRAAKLWGELESPYEEALALTKAGDERTLRRALDQLQGLGAQSTAAIISRRLRERGARGLPRGPRASTRENPAGLTPRELEVLALVAEGLRTAEIAKQLVVAEKTVGHHISAILRKLDVRTRGEAAAKARRMGLVQDR
jgi:DNA-binding CsgD family transcriptional regulator